MLASHACYQAKTVSNAKQIGYDETYMNRVALLIPFLAMSLALVQAQDLPAGKGKALVENTCGSCHGLDVVIAQHATKDGWQSIVDYMVSRGATGTPEE